MNALTMHATTICPSAQQATQIQATCTRKPDGCHQPTLSVFPNTNNTAHSANFRLQFASPCIRHSSTLQPFSTCFKLLCWLLRECPFNRGPRIHHPPLSCKYPYVPKINLLFGNLSVSLIKQWPCIFNISFGQRQSSFPYPVLSIHLLLVPQQY